MGYLQNHSFAFAKSALFYTSDWLLVAHTSIYTTLAQHFDLGDQTAQFYIFKVISTTILTYFDVV